MDGSTTQDSLAGGRLQLEQSRTGFRFGLDSVILATDLPRLPASGGRVVDLGAGHGAVSCLVALQTNAEIVAVERQSSLLKLLRRNVTRNDLGERIEVREGDVRFPAQTLEPHKADLVVINPPFYRPGEGRLSPDEERREAHHELHGGLVDFIRAAAFALKPAGGRMKIVLPPGRLIDLVTALVSTDLGLESLRFVHDHPEAPAYLFEGIARRQSKSELRIDRPLFIHEGCEDVYSDDMAKRLNP